jgi:hypothetical protein
MVHLRWRGVLALNLIRRTELPPGTKVSAKHGTHAIANPLLPVGILLCLYAVIQLLFEFQKDF